MISFILLNITGLLITFAMMFFVWRLGIRMNKASIVDVFWSLIIALVAIYFMTMNGGFGLRAFLMIVMICAWALRLSFYIIHRSDNLRIEDSRYKNLKEKWGKDADLKMLKFYFQQGAGGMLFAWPAFFVSISGNASVGIFECLGFIVWLIALCGETYSDLTLIRFKADPDNKARVCRKGLWAYSRHPNYFFEWLVWVGICIYTLGSPFGWVSIVCPVSMYYFLNHVTGVPFTERESSRFRGADSEAYRREVNAFFPWFPNRSGGLR